MSNFLLYLKHFCGDPKIRYCGKLALILSLIGISFYAFADDGTDLLSGTTTNLVKTLSGTGMKFVYLTEGIVSLAAYIKTKNLLVLSGIVVVSIFFNIIIHVVNG